MNRPEVLELDRISPAVDGRSDHVLDECISAAALMKKHFAPIEYVSPSLLAEGATVLGGKPKIGKSWFVLDLALAVAGGEPALGAIPVSTGDVLYLALEDNQRRLQQRLRKKGMEDAPDRLSLATRWPSMDDECLEKLEAWVQRVPRPRLIIVDVLQMVRPTAKRGGKSYDDDYGAVSPLAAFARKHGIAILIVHHERKMPSDDPLEGLSGTNGLTGAADSVMVLHRDNGTGNFKLYVRGRDIEESEKAVRFDADFGTWHFLGNADQVGRTNERQEVISMLQRVGKPLSPKEVSDQLGKPRDAVRKLMARMSMSGEIQKQGRGSYTCHKCPNVPTDAEADIVTLVTGAQ